MLQEAYITNYLLDRERPLSSNRISMITRMTDDIPHPLLKK